MELLPNAGELALSLVTFKMLDVAKHLKK